MNGPVVVDASTIVKLVVAENDSDKAVRLYLDCIANQYPLAGPSHLLGEAVNAIHPRWRSSDPAKHLTEFQAYLAVASLLQYKIQLIDSFQLYSRAAVFARTHGLLTIYDSLYVVLAETLGVELWTADRRLVRQVATLAPWVRWLGEYPGHAEPGA
jgi:predicted nucleic acid-binding protein